ncbi:MAG: polysaccharide deacetylase family protein [Chitinophagaceae bacterium]|nr:polysaccharide deacetylase family protein [Chitinophagaceae bacterium]
MSKKLGFNENTKLLMIHADDAGLSHSENLATIQCLEKGIVSSYSIMVPCSGFREMAVFAKKNPRYDYGIHLTLTCEWESNRFGPVLPISEVQSLVDKNGHFYKKREELKKKAYVDEVRNELEAQIEKAYEFGLNPTHLDAHMYSVGTTPEFFEIYKDLGKKFGLPVLISKEMIDMASGGTGNYITDNDFVVDKLYLGEYEDFEKGQLRGYYESLFHHLADGLNVLLIHPAFDDDEMKKLTVNHPNFGAEWRQIDFDFLTSENSRSMLKENNIALISWSDIKKAFFSDNEKR